MFLFGVRWSSLWTVKRFRTGMPHQDRLTRKQYNCQRKQSSSSDTRDKTPDYELRQTLACPRYNIPNNKNPKFDYQEPNDSDGVLEAKMRKDLSLKQGQTHC